MILATFNVNSIRARLPNVLAWLESATPDAVLVQEIKCEDADFPLMEITAAGYEALIKGQKAYHGVALLTRTPASLVLDTLDNGEARYLEADYMGLRLINIYAPNGNPLGSEKFPYKLGWLAKLEARLKTLLADEVPFLVGGDFNIIPEELDCYNAAAWKGDALFQPESRAAYRRLLNLGLYDAFRALHPTALEYTFWDYQGGAWPQNHGIRIDHFLLSPLVADRLLQCSIDKAPRGAEKASDHTPLILTLR
jgi:exodeoxyribonuclease III